MAYLANGTCPQQLEIKREWKMIHYQIKNNKEYSRDTDVLRPSIKILVDYRTIQNQVIDKNLQVHGNAV